MIPDACFRGHVKKLVDYIEREGFDAAVIADPSNLYYLTRFETGVAVIFRDRVVLVVPQLEAWRAEENAVYDELVTYGREVSEKFPNITFVKAEKMSDVVKKVLKDAKVGKVCGDSQGTRYVSDLEPKDVTSEIHRMRAVKDEYEVAAIKRAIEVSEKAYQTALKLIRPGATERDIAAQLIHSMVRSGAEELAFWPIVAAGENAAYPHHKPTDRDLRPGDLVIIDWGARVDGYCADITRTIAVTKPSEKQKQLYEAVLEALHNAIDAAQPGTKAYEVDAVARKTLEKHGLAKHFIHSTGHALGIQVHDPTPRIAAADDTTLEPGMVITIEPGIYLRKTLGIRIEEDVLITNKGPKVLTRVEKEIF